MKRFWDKVDRSGGDDACWPWLAAVRHNENPLQHYGVFWRNGRNWVATHVAWELEDGTPVPQVLSVLHRCDNPRCVNPAHLFLGTQSDNCRDKSRKLRQNGETHARSKLTDDAVRSIRARSAAGEAHTAIAADHGITGANVGYIVKRTTWRHVA